MRIKLIVIALSLSTLFSACSVKKEYISPKLPKLRTCVVSKKKVEVEKCGTKLCLDRNNYRVLKKQNYRLRVCNELLNKQNKDYNKRYAR